MKNKLFLNKQLKDKIREISNSGNDAFYLYDTKKIQQNCRELLNVPYAPKSVHFAMMANSTPQFLSIIKQEGLNIFVNSIMHLELAMQLGYEGGQIVFAASAMDEVTMRKVNDYGALVILDSIGQFEQWQSLFPNSSVGIRCNIGELVVPKKTLAGYFIGKDSRLGLTIDEIEKLKGNPHILGLHIYVGTNITDISYFLECYSQIVKLAEWFPDLRFLDFGGGFGLSEGSSKEFDMKTYGHNVLALMNQVSEKTGRQIKLILEPGRIIGGDAGYFICKVVDIKGRGSNQFIGVNASSVQFPRPLFYPDSAFHPVSILRNNESLNGEFKHVSTIYGCSTYSRDFLAQNILLPQVSVGDLVVLGYAGSYCATAHTSFLGFPRVEEYFL